MLKETYPTLTEEERKETAQNIINERNPVAQSD